MFRVLERRRAAVHALADPAAVAPPPKGVVRWVDCTAPDAAALDLLRARFDFHPLALEDCAHFDQRGKLEEYADHCFIVIHGITAAAADATQVRLHELHAFLGAGYLVTVHDRPMPALDAVWARVAADPALAGRGADFFGQNFQQLPGLPDWTRSGLLTWAMLLACVAVPAAMLAWFRRRHWL